MKEFRDGFEQGCRQENPDVKNQRGYCTCMANSYQARYSGVELRAISQLAGNLGERAAIVNLMMAPEAWACNAKYKRAWLAAAPQNPKPRKRENRLNCLHCVADATSHPRKLLGSSHT